MQTQQRNSARIEQTSKHQNEIIQRKLLQFRTITIESFVDTTTLHWSFSHTLISTRTRYSIVSTRRQSTNGMLNEPLLVGPSNGRGLTFICFHSSEIGSGDAECAIAFAFFCFSGDPPKCRNAVIFDQILTIEHTHCEYKQRSQRHSIHRNKHSDNRQQRKII